jgi:hypothetical protein
MDEVKTTAYGREDSAGGTRVDPRIIGEWASAGWVSESSRNGWKGIPQSTKNGSFAPHVRHLEAAFFRILKNVFIWR